MITRSQRAFINSALPVLKKDERIVGVALGGAHAHGKVDEYSGLEFIIAVELDRFESIMEDRQDIAASLGRLLACFPADHISRPEMLICLYDGESLQHVGLFFRPLDKISHRVVDPEILYERDNLMSAEYAKRPAEIPEPDLQWYEDRFWIWVHYIASSILRGELFDAIEGLSLIRQRILGPLLLIKNGRPPWGVRSVEDAAPDEVPRLIETLAAHDAKSCLRALKSATDLYIYLRGYNRTGLISREEAQRCALQFLNGVSDQLS